jgi:hypothetical protein
MELNQRFTVELAGSTCPVCKRPMIGIVGWEPKDNPIQHQLAALDVQTYSGHSHPDTGEPICESCGCSPLLMFTCSLCGEQRGMDEREEVFGHTWFCVHCFETVTAKAWEEATNEARRRDTRYDDE